MKNGQLRERDDKCRLQLYGGTMFSLKQPDPKSIEIESVAMSLARKCRFGGHSREFYSVAQHSILVARILEHQGEPPVIVLAGLLHDAHEALWGFGDVCRPALLLDRAVIRFLRRHRAEIDRVIADRFGFSDLLFDEPVIYRADNIALATEARDLMYDNAAWASIFEPWPEPIHAVGWVRAYDRFLEEFNRLTAAFRTGEDDGGGA